jgi:UDP-N-acetylglucosamine acyltransferase
MIHPTAIVDPSAWLDTEVSIGPHVVIEGPVRIMAGTEVQAHAVITGNVNIGRDNRIGYGAIIGSYPQDLSFDPKSVSGVEVGDANVIREYCTIHRGTKEGSQTRIGSNNLLMVGAHLGHNTRIGNHVILANNVLLGGYAEIQDRVFIGGGSVVHQFTRVGTISLLQGISGVGKDIPPFAIAVGKNSISAVNVIGLRRAGFNAALRREVREAFDLYYRKDLNMRQALESAKERAWSAEVQPFWDFVATSKRGVCGWNSWRNVKGATALDEEEGT